MENNKKSKYGLFITIILMIIVLVACLFWYKVSTTIKEVPNQVEDFNGEIEEKNEIDENTSNKDDNQSKDDVLFTLENYPKVDASLAIHPLANSIASSFLGIDEENLDFKYTTTRSSEVYRRLIDSEVDVIIAAQISDEDMEYAKEKGVELEIIPLTSSAFVFIVNKENPISNLSLDQIQQIYSGEITNWKEVGGNDEEIIAYQRPNGSGSQTAMMNLVMDKKELQMAPTIQVEEEMGGLVDAIAEYDNAKNAIGYSYFYYVNTMYKKDTIKLIGVDGVIPSIETIKSGEYPLYTNGFIVYRKDNTNDNLKIWLDNLFSERGSKIIEENGYVPIN